MIHTHLLYFILYFFFLKKIFLIIFFSSKVFSIKFRVWISRHVCPRVNVLYVADDSWAKLYGCFYFFFSLYSLFSQHFFFLSKTIFQIFSRHPIVAASTKERIFTADTDVHHLRNKRKWEWFRPVLYSECVWLTQRNQDMHNWLMFSHTNILMEEYLQSPVKNVVFLFT